MLARVAQPVGRHGALHGLHAGGRHWCGRPVAATAHGAGRLLRAQTGSHRAKIPRWATGAAVTGTEFFLSWKGEENAKRKTYGTHKLWPQN